MAVKKLLEKEAEEIKHHLETTQDIMVKAYTLTQLAVLEWKTPMTIKNSWKFIPVRIDDRNTKYKYLRWEFKKPYAVRYIRVDEIKHIYRKRNRKTELVEQFR